MIPEVKNRNIHGRISLGLIFSVVFAFSSGQSVAAGTFNFGNGAEPKDLDPQIVTGVPEHHILLNLFEPLVSPDPKTLAPVPGVAESWKVSKDGKTYIFKLRKNAKWSNGEPVTAQDFVYAWTRLLTPATAAEYAYQAYYMKNGKAFNEGKLKDAAQLGFKARDPYTLEVQLENPTPFFLGLLSHHSLYPVSKAAIEKFGARWTRPENMVSNGAFSLEKWEMNKVVTLKKNEQYWDKANV
jgi:oligopeptide transport system substrate-binding protein